MHDETTPTTTEPKRRRRYGPPPMHPSGLSHVNVRLPNDMIESLRRMAKRDNLSEVIRAALAAYIQRNR